MYSKPLDPLSAPSDTDPRIHAELVVRYRQMSPQAKLEQVTQLTQAVQQLALVDLRRRYPQADERELQLRLASRWLPADWLRAHLGWDPDIEGR